MLPSWLLVAILFVLILLATGSQKVPAWVPKADFPEKVCRASKNSEVKKSHAVCGALVKSDPTLADRNSWEVHSTSVPRLIQGTRLDDFPRLPKTFVCHLGAKVEQKKAKQKKIRTHRILLGRPGPVP